MGAAGKVHAIQANVSAAFPLTSEDDGCMHSWAGMDVKAQSLNVSAAFVVGCPGSCGCECERPSLRNSMVRGILEQRWVFGGTHINK